MSRTGLAWMAILGLILPGCEENIAPGNDREAHLSPPEPPAELSSVVAAIEGVGNDLLLPQPMTAADLRNVPSGVPRCIFSYTRVGLPVFAFGSAGVVKLNDQLVSLPTLADGQFAADGLSITIRPVEEPREGAEPFVSDLVLWLPGADHERGFQGFSRCEAHGSGT